MKRKIILLFFIIQLFVVKSAFSVFLDINIYSSFEINSIDFSPISGKYILEADEKILNTFHKGVIVNITPLRDSVLLQINHQNVGLFKEITLYGRGFLNSFSLINDADNIPKRSYEDHLKVRVVEGKLQLINNVDLEHYVAGVVQAESGGSSDNIEFFYVQAITCRTYALVNYLKHTVDGYNLCDEVHCQYYTGRSRISDVTRAVARTSGEVIVDSNFRMISAAFHSNCGGETVNSEDVWTLPMSYLRSRNDSFCTSMSKAKWEVVLPKDTFINKLCRNFDLTMNDSLVIDSALNYKQEHRKVDFVNNINLKYIRQKFGLRSTFFETELKGDSLYIHGRGFGHGVGLCQQGAIRMAELGIDYHKIMKYYYKNTSVIHFSELKYAFMPQF